MSVIKPLNSEVDLGSANTVYNSSLVYLTNTAGSNTVVTLADSEANTSYTFTVASATSLVIQKAPLATLAGTNCKAFPIAYKN